MASPKKTKTNKKTASSVSSISGSPALHLLGFVGEVATLNCVKEAYQGSKTPNVGFTSHVSFARANDGCIFRNLNNGFRWFVSDKGKWEGKVGVSGKVRAQLETTFSNVQFAWVQQGNKNYYYTSQVEQVVNYLSK